MLDALLRRFLCKCWSDWVIKFAFCFAQQEEELRKQGGKYAHLNEDLHVYVEAFGHPVDVYQQLAHALFELRRHLVPVSHRQVLFLLIKVFKVNHGILVVFFWFSAYWIRGLNVKRHHSSRCWASSFSCKNVFYIFYFLIKTHILTFFICWTFFIF